MPPLPFPSSPTVARQGRRKLTERRCIAVRRMTKRGTSTTRFVVSLPLFRLDSANQGSQQARRAEREKSSSRVLPGLRLWWWFLDASGVVGAPALWGECLCLPGDHFDYAKWVRMTVRKPLLAIWRGKYSRRAATE